MGEDCTRNTRTLKQSSILTPLSISRSASSNPASKLPWYLTRQVYFYITEEIHARGYGVCGVHSSTSMVVCEGNRASKALLRLQSIRITNESSSCVLRRVLWPNSG
jgi:hypothetical protein